MSTEYELQTSDINDVFQQCEDRQAAEDGLMVLSKRRVRAVADLNGHDAEWLGKRACVRLLMADKFGE